MPLDGTGGGGGQFRQAGSYGDNGKADNQFTHPESKRNFLGAPDEKPGTEDQQGQAQQKQPPGFARRQYRDMFHIRLFGGVRLVGFALYQERENRRQCEQKDDPVDPAQVVIVEKEARAECCRQQQGDFPAH